MGLSSINLPKGLWSILPFNPRWLSPKHFAQNCKIPHVFGLCDLLRVFPVWTGANAHDSLRGKSDKKFRSNFFRENQRNLLPRLRQSSINCRKWGQEKHKHFCFLLQFFFVENVENLGVSFRLFETAQIFVCSAKNQSTTSSNAKFRASLNGFFANFPLLPSSKIYVQHFFFFFWKWRCEIEGESGVATRWTGKFSRLVTCAMFSLQRWVGGGPDNFTISLHRKNRHLCKNCWRRKVGSVYTHKNTKRRKNKRRSKQLDTHPSMVFWILVFRQCSKNSWLKGKVGNFLYFSLPSASPDSNCCWPGAKGLMWSKQWRRWPKLLPWIALISFAQSNEGWGGFWEKNLFWRQNLSLHEALAKVGGQSQKKNWFEKRFEWVHGPQTPTPSPVCPPCAQSVFVLSLSLFSLSLAWRQWQHDQK